MLRKLFLLLILITPVIAQAEIYKWTDANGVAHYSDTPQKNATPMQLSDEQTYHAVLPTPQSTPSVFAEDSKQTNYSQIKIITPKDQQTFANNEQGNIKVKINLKPALKTSDKLLLLLDDKATGNAQTSTIFFLNNVDRGEHALQAQVIDTNNKVIISGDKITFYMQRPMISKKKFKIK